MNLHRLRRWLLILLGLAVILPPLALLAGWLAARASLPDLEGELLVEGLGGQAEILRDSDGVVTIRAESESDAAFALGYAHAQDRLWQMDFMRRAGAGRLSEVVGEATYPMDRLLRGLGLYRTAEANLAVLPETGRQLLESYAAGVNRLIDDQGWLLPPEFLLLRYRPEPWKPADSLVWGRLMALQLSGNWRDEMLRARLEKRLTGAQLEDLWPGYPSDGPVSTAALFAPASETPRSLAEILPWDLMPKKASNAWALSGERSREGAPLLANDPHLSLSAPGTWYLTRIETPGRLLAGATAPGVPFLILGRNDDIAWGFTTTESDTQDLFLERETAGQPGFYDSPDGPLPFETREEIIGVRGEEPQKLTLRSTRHGPLLSDFLPEAAELAGPGQALALSWPALAPDDSTAEGLYRLNQASDWATFLAAMKLFHSPQQTILYADRQGHIGLAAPARVPVRKAGDGETPAPGWDGSHDWEGYLPFEELPQRLDPDSGRLVAANNRLTPPDYPNWLARRWANPERAQRIQDLLDAETPADLERQAVIQTDSLSLAATRLLPLMLQAPALTPLASEAQGLLRGWDFRMDRRRPEPLIFTAWLDALNRTLLADELGPDFGSFARPNPLRLARILGGARSWCDNNGTPAAEDCDSQLSASLDQALADLQATYGEDMTAWRWGQAHRARLAHPLFSRLPLLGGLLNEPLETDGGNFTVNRGGLASDGPFERRFEHVHGPGYRGLYDLADSATIRAMIATGQSGHPLSEHYLDLALRWRDGAYLSLSAPDISAAKRLLLLPK